MKLISDGVSGNPESVNTLAAAVVGGRSVFIVGSRMMIDDLDQGWEGRRKPTVATETQGNDGEEKLNGANGEK